MSSRFRSANPRGSASNASWHRRHSGIAFMSQDFCAIPCGPVCAGSTPQVRRQQRRAGVSGIAGTSDRARGVQRGRSAGVEFVMADSRFQVYVAVRMNASTASSMRRTSLDDSYRLEVYFRAMQKRKRKKDPAAVKLGARGGKKRARNMTAAQRSDAARHAINARWSKYRAGKVDAA